MNEKEYSLMVDLSKLLKKYGSETFESLASNLNSREFCENLATILNKSASVVRSSTIVARKPLETEIEALKKTDKKKYELISTLEMKIRTGRVLGTLKDIKGFAASNDLPEIRSDSRQKAVGPLLRMLVRLPTDQLEQILAGLLESGISDRDLTRWSDIITKRMSRTK